VDSARLKNAVRPADFYRDDARAKQNKRLTAMVMEAHEKEDV